MDTDKAIFMKILIVEDEPSLRELMQKTLAKERYVVETAGTFHEASLKIADYSYDCILLDIMLPDGNGLKLLEMLKEQQKRESVIIISARDSIEDKVLGLEQGADDYLPKPFHLAELNARIKSVLRRQRSDGSRSLRLGNLRIEPDSFRVFVDDKELNFSRKNTTSCSILPTDRTISLTRPYWPKPSGATISIRRTVSISSMHKSRICASS